jgi:phosphohistidine phosphatase
MGINMQLYLVQHGKTKSKEEDPDRPLTDEGATDVRKVAAYVAENADIHVNKILHSGKTRALQTAEIVAEHLIPWGGVEMAENLAPLDDPTLWAQRLKGETEDLMLVGHLPHLAMLTSLLVCRSIEKKPVSFKNGGIVCLGRDDEGDYSVMWIVTPDIVK